MKTEKLIEPKLFLLCQRFEDAGIKTCNYDVLPLIREVNKAQTFALRQFVKDQKNTEFTCNLANLFPTEYLTISLGTLRENNMFDHLDVKFKKK